MDRSAEITIFRGVAPIRAQKRARASPGLRSRDVPKVALRAKLRNTRPTEDLYLDREPLMILAWQKSPVINANVECAERTRLSVVVAKSICEIADIVEQRIWATVDSPEAKTLEWKEFVARTRGRAASEAYRNHVDVHGCLT